MAGKKIPVRKLADKTILQKVKPTTEENTYYYYRCDTCGIELDDSHINANLDHVFPVHVEREAIIQEDE